VSGNILRRYARDASFLATIAANTVEQCIIFYK
jgi:hypothetical protein